MKKILIALATGLLVAGLIWKTTREEPIKATLTVAESGAVESTVANTRAGTIRACQRSKLSLAIGGRVAELLVSNGDRVEQHQPLLVLWNEDQKARKAQADALVTAAGLRQKEACFAAARDKREADRQTRLASRQLVSEEALDMAKTRAKISEYSCMAARAGIDEARANALLQTSLLDQTILRAPFNGVVAEINGEIGEYVTPSPPGVATPPAVDLINDRCLYVRAPIDEVDAAAIQLSMPARISLDAFGERVFEGTVSRIAPYVRDYEKQARTVDIEVTFNKVPEDLQLLIGYSADIEIILERRENVIRIPTETVLEGNKVYRYSPDTQTLEEVEFEPGISNWSYTQVASGLQPGDRILQSLDLPDLQTGLKVIPDND